MSRRVLVTGAASGLGFQIALRFIRSGARVLLTDVDEAAGRSARDELAQHGEAVFQPLDVTDAAAWPAVIDWCEREWGGLDVLVNNAGVAAMGEFELIEPADWEWITKINLLGVVWGARAAVPVFKRQGSGHIVNIASMAGLMNLPGMASYNVTKAGVISLSETLRHELAPDGIRTTVVCPSFFATNLADRARSTDPVFTAGLAKLMRKATVTAADVAEQVFAAVARGEFLVVTHPEARRALRWKRLRPSAVDRRLAEQWARTRASLARSKGNS